jgi:hypothetical protein
MVSEVYADQATTSSRVETLIQTVKRLEEEGRHRDILLSKAISENEIRAAAAMDGAAYAQHTAVESGNAANDASRCYSKQCLVFSGDAMPARLERLEDDDGPKYLINKVLIPLFGVRIEVEEIAVAHYKKRSDKKDATMIARFTRQCPGSAYVRILDASRSLSVKYQDKTVTRKVKVWARINESGQDAHISYLLRQMVKAGQATGITVGMGGRVSAMVKYGAAPDDFRRLQFSTVSDVREIMNRESRAEEKKSDTRSGSRRAEVEYNRQTGMGMFKLVMNTSARQKVDYRCALEDNGKEPALSEAMRIGIGMENEDRLKALTWQTGPNSAFGIMNDPGVKQTKKRGHPGGNGNTADLGPPPSKKTINLEVSQASKNLQNMAAGSRNTAK